MAVSSERQKGPAAALGLRLFCKALFVIAVSGNDASEPRVPEARQENFKGARSSALPLRFGHVSIRGRTKTTGRLRRGRRQALPTASTLGARAASRSDLLDARLALPVAELAAGLEEPVDIACRLERDEAFVHVVLDESLLEQRTGVRAEGDELQMGEGVGDEVACGRLIGEQLDAFWRAA
jgi:hypothetical protein